MEEAIEEARAEAAGGGREAAAAEGAPTDLVLVLQGDLYLVPWAALRAGQQCEFLWQRFRLILVPSVAALQPSKPDARNEVQVGHVAGLTFSLVTLSLVSFDKV